MDDSGNQTTALNAKNGDKYSRLQIATNGDRPYFSKSDGTYEELAFSIDLPFINPSNILHTYEKDTTYTATQNCIASGFVKIPQGININIKINNVQIQYLSNDANADSVITLPIFIPIKSGQRLTMSTAGGDITTLGQWSINIYATA